MIRTCAAGSACIVGAGPVGSLAALLLARSGWEVDLLEADAERRRRLGGEWLHPAAVDILSRVLPPLRVDYPTGLGFVVFPEDGSPPIPLPYAAGRRGLAIEHAALVDHLRGAALEAPGIRLQAPAHVRAIEGERIACVGAADAQQRLSANLILGADGRSSTVRRLSGLSGNRSLLSCMAGLILSDVTLPYEGYGHVLLGAPGPILAYRIGIDRVRVCLDVPLDRLQSPQRTEFLQEHYAPRLPQSWREVFFAALSADALQWATNEQSLDREYGQGNVRLLGDAAGCLHPITACGMTLGFQDAEAVCAHPALADYARQRDPVRSVAQRLARALYAAFSRRDDEARAVRQGIYRLWRSSAAERTRTMQILCAEASARWHFNRVFLKVAAFSVQPLMREIVTTDQWQRPGLAWRRLHRQMHWLDGRMLPR